eukprot:3256668-Pleurochrysis_carterae.AAC.2
MVQAALQEAFSINIIAMQTKASSPMKRFVWRYPRLRWHVRVLGKRPAGLTILQFCRYTRMQNPRCRIDEIRNTRRRHDASEEPAARGVPAAT